MQVIAVVIRIVLKFERCCSYEGVDTPKSVDIPRKAILQGVKIPSPSIFENALNPNGTSQPRMMQPASLALKNITERIPTPATTSHPHTTPLTRLAHLTHHHLLPLALMAPLFFWRPTGPHGFLSQWYPCAFTAPSSSSPPTPSPSTATTTTPTSSAPTTTDTAPSSPHHHSLTFTSTEQYMMYRKAALFSSPTLAAQILQTSDPRKQQALGKKVPGFDGEIWDREKGGIVEEGNWWKFVGGKSVDGEGDGEGLRGRLLGTGGRELVEASPRDRIWGIGFVAEGAEGRRGEWGENLLGKALMRVRERLREEDKGKGEGEGS